MLFGKASHGFSLFIMQQFFVHSFVPHAARHKLRIVAAADFGRVAHPGAHPAERHASLDSQRAERMLENVPPARHTGARCRQHAYPDLYVLAPGGRALFWI